ncbi:MAG: hypothetical protein NTY61_02915 [Candidatus Parcubacteria bacterium]|nr:hypothetical protein [Candidatus Parcubacteria bacterium]
MVIFEIQSRYGPEAVQVEDDIFTDTIPNYDNRVIEAQKIADALESEGWANKLQDFKREPISSSESYEVAGYQVRIKYDQYSLSFTVAKAIF